jgi:hypothetical protein
VKKPGRALIFVTHFTAFATVFALTAAAWCFVVSA